MQTPHQFKPNLRMQLGAFLPLIALLLALSGCSNNAGQNKIKLVVWGLFSSEDTKGRDAMVAEFERRHPNIKVSLLQMGAGNMDPQKLMTAIVGKTPPDLINQDRF